MFGAGPRLESDRTGVVVACSIVSMAILSIGTRVGAHPRGPFQLIIGSAAATFTPLKPTEVCGNPIVIVSAAARLPAAESGC